MNPENPKSLSGYLSPESRNLRRLMRDHKAMTTNSTKKLGKPKKACDNCGDCLTVPHANLETPCQHPRPVKTFYVTHVNCDCASGDFFRTTRPQATMKCPLCTTQLGPMQFTVIATIRATSTFDAQEKWSDLKAQTRREVRAIINQGAKP